MEKTIKIGDKYINFKATGGILCRYKEQFGNEYYDDYLKIKNPNEYGLNEFERLKLSAETGYKLIWAMAKTADNSMPDPELWLDGFDKFPMAEILPQINELFEKSTITGRENNTDNESSPLTSESLVACCILAGLSMDDINNMSIGFLLNYVDEYIKIKTGTGTNENTKKASQSDFDNF